MYKKALLLVIFSLFILTTYYVIPNTVFAQNTTAPALNLTVFPATIELSAVPGSTIQQKIRIRNNSSAPLSLGIQTSKLSTDSKGNVVPVDSTDSYLSWVSYSPSNFIARPNEWTDVTIQIKIPDSAAFGYYFAIRITPTSGIKTNQKNGSTLIGQALVPILLDVKKAGETANIQLVSFTPTAPLFEYLPATFNVTFLNKGNVHVRPLGNVFIRNGTNDVAVLDFNDSGSTMLPSEKRTFVASWNDGFLVEEPVILDNAIQRDSSGNPITHLVIHWDRLPAFRIGQYTAHLLAVYDNGTRDVPIEATVTFWVFPWKVLLGTLFGVLILIFLVRIWLKWYVKRQIGKYKSS